MNPKKPPITPHLGLFSFLINVNTGLNQCWASKSFTLYTCYRCECLGFVKPPFLVLEKKSEMEVL
jgi:hypothetical protein